MAKERIILSWSGGKDSAYALFQLLKEDKYEVAYLLSTFNGHLHSLSMHGIREQLIEDQATLIGIPLLKVYVYETNNEEYERLMRAVLEKVYAEGITKVAFGDIFLEDLRRYREERMQEMDMTCLFPLWKRDTRELVIDFIEKGFKTYTCCINDAYLDETMAGRLIDMEFVDCLPATVDPCGENGEFHTFCVDGPIFKHPLAAVRGETIYRPLDPAASSSTPSLTGKPTKGFWYCDFDHPNTS